jgi:hypothetical protein
MDHLLIIGIIQCSNKSYITITTFITLQKKLYNLNRIKEMFNNDATELYLSFTKNNQHLLQRISLGDIASYICISQVTLSRIRARK